MNGKGVGGGGWKKCIHSTNIFLTDCYVPDIGLSVLDMLSFVWDLQVDLLGTDLEAISFCLNIISIYNISIGTALCGLDFNEVCYLLLLFAILHNSILWKAVSIEQAQVLIIKLSNKIHNWILEFYIRESSRLFVGLKEKAQIRTQNTGDWRQEQKQIT